jgi:DNA-binding MarR family transcriptional regulator
MSEAAELRRLVQRFVRGFGLLQPDSTPCGHPLPTSHAHALLVLHETPELTQNELAAVLGLDKSNVSRLVARLLRSGHLLAVPGAEDRRERRLSLTAKGEKLAGAIDATSRARFERLLGGIPRRAALFDVLGDLVAALDQLEVLS